MTECTGCGLPAAPGLTHCSYCAGPLPASLPERVQVRSADEQVEVSGPDGVFSVALRNGHHWNLRRPDGSPMLRLAPLATAAGTSFAVIAPDARLLGTILHPRSGEPNAVVAGPDGSTEAALYTDGPTGLHLVGRDGEVHGLVSREPIFGGMAFDVLLTPTGRELPAELMVALLVSLGVLVSDPRQLG